MQLKECLSTLAGRQAGIKCYRQQQQVTGQSLWTVLPYIQLHLCMEEEGIRTR